MFLFKLLTGLLVMMLGHFVCRYVSQCLRSECIHDMRLCSQDLL